MNVKFLSLFFFTPILFIAACEDQGDPVSPIVSTPVPSIVSVTPDSGAVGDTVKLTGTNFGSIPGTSVVKFGSTPAVTYISWSATEVQVKIPAGASTDSVSIIVNNKTSNKKKFTIIIITGSPLLTSIAPDSGKTGDTITVNGSNFGSSRGTSVVSFGSIPAITYVSWSETQIKSVIPVGLASGSINVSVTVGSKTSNAKPFKGIVLITFSTDITGLINKYNCKSCHGAGSTFNNFNLTTYENLMLGTSSHGPVVTKYDGANSIIVKKLLGTAGFGGRMPQGGGTLTDDEIQKIIEWINQGALKN
ncbi:MAG: IPT/TIG domain-containing protein [Bacteriovoracaceae bacterium]|nr:IPT/TIG domain-containing protein [Bacteroidota bacterium]